LKKRKILIVGPAYPFRGGIAHFNNALAMAYSKLDFNVQIFSFSLQYPKFLFPGKSQYENGVAPLGINIYSIINSINPFNWINIARKINNERPDYIIIRYWLPFMAPCLGTIARLVSKKIKIIAITDNIIPHEKRIGDHILTKYFLKSCDAFVTLSKSVLKDLSQFVDTDLKVFIPHPIYDIFGDKISKKSALSNLGLADNKKYLLFFGFIRKYKGLDLLIKALSDSRLRKLDVKLIIAGEFYDNQKEYLTLINELDLRNQIIINSSFIPTEKVKDFFCASDLVAQTYRTATQSGVTQIAYHFERPMLVTDVGGLSEIVSNQKVGYVTAKDPKAIADAINDFYINKKENEFVKNTIEEKKRFSWNNFVNEIENLKEIL
tara:strand:+ start:121 stop:1254 length:1134 start_codon:yes stop_codon:yes gene_type:complete